MVGFRCSALVLSMGERSPSKIREKRITLEESARFLKFYEQGMGSYTYLTHRPQPIPLPPALPAPAAAHEPAPQAEGEPRPGLALTAHVAEEDKG